MKGEVHVCSFQAGPDIRRGKEYEQLKAEVLAAGRFSVFEATASDRAAEFYSRLCRDDDVETWDMGFPWTGVRRRAGSKPRRKK